MTRWQRARGHDFDFAQGVPSVEAVADKFSEICNFDNGQADNPDLPADGNRYTISNVFKDAKKVSKPSKSLNLIVDSLSSLQVEGLKQDRANRKHLSKI